MTDENKRLNWDLDLDLNDFKREMGSVAKEISGVGKSVEDFAKKADQSTDRLSADFKTLGNDIKSALRDAFKEVGNAIQEGMKAGRQAVKEVDGAVREMGSAWRHVKSEVQSARQSVNQVLNETRQQLVEAQKQVRQFNMSDLQKQADNYSTAIKKSRQQVEELQRALQSAKLEDKERLNLSIKLREAQNNLRKTQQAGLKSNALGIDREVLQVLDGAQSKLQQINEATRQHGMAEWQKTAVQYQQAIKKSLAEVERLKGVVGQTNLLEKDRIKIQQKIIASEKAIEKVTKQAAAHVAILRKEEEAAARAADQAAAAAKKVEVNFRNVADTAQSIGMAAGGAFIALTAALTVAVRESGKLEEQIIKFGAVSSASDSELAAVRQTVLDLGANSAYTASEIGSASVELAKMGFTAQETQDALGGMVEASIASGDSLEEVSSTIASTIRTFNLQASEAGRVGDIITRGANISAQSFRSFADSMKYVGSAAAGANQDLVDISGMLALLSDRGLKASIAGNGLENALIRLQAQPAPTAAALEKLNVAIADTKGTASTADDEMRPMLDIIKDIKKEFSNKGIGKIEQAGILKDLFGEVSLKTMQVFFNTSNDVIDGVMDKQRQFRGSTKETADKMREGFNYAITEMQSAINALQISLGDELAPAIQAIAGGIKTVVNALNELPGPIKFVFVNGLAVITAFIGALVGSAGMVWAFGQVGTAITQVDGLMGGTLIPRLKGVLHTGAHTTGRLSGLFTKLARGPMAGVAATAGTIYLAFKTNFGGLMDILNNFLDFLLGPNREALDIWKTDWKETIHSLKMFWTGFVGIFTGSFLTMLGMFDHATAAFLAMIGNISRSLGLLFKGDVIGAQGEANTALSKLKEMAEILTLNEKTIARFRERARGKFFPGLDKELDEQKKKQEEIHKETINHGHAEIKQERTKLELILDQNKARLKGIDNAKTKALTDAEHNHKPHSQNIQFDAGGAPVTSKFGPRWGRMHTGIDIGKGMGAPITAEADATVAFSGWMGTQNSGYGRTVILDVGGGNYVLYGHASKLYKKVGDKVKKGEQIAAVGSSGGSTGPHEHREYRRGGPAGTRGVKTVMGGAYGVPYDPKHGMVLSGEHSDPSEEVENQYSVKRVKALFQALGELKKLKITMSESDKEYQKLIEAIADIEGQINNERLKSAKAESKAREEAAKNEQERLAFIQKIKEEEQALNQKLIEQVESHAEKSAESLQSSFESFAKKASEFGDTLLDKSNFQAYAKDFGESLKQSEKDLVAHSDLIQGVQSSIDDLLKKDNLTEDQKQHILALQNTLAGYQADYDRLSKERQSLLNEEGDKWDLLREKIASDNASESAADAVERFNEALEETEEDIRGIESEFDAIQSAVYTLGGAFDDVISIIGRFSEDAQDMLSDLGRSVEGVVGGVAQLGKGIASGNVSEIIAGTAQAGASYWGFIIDQFQKMSGAARNAQRDVENLLLSLAEGEIGKIDRQIQMAETNGGNPLALKERRARIQGNISKGRAAQAFNDKYGDNFVNIDAQGNLVQKKTRVSGSGQSAQWNRDLEVLKEDLERINQDVAIEVRNTYSSMYAEINKRMGEEADKIRNEAAQKQGKENWERYTKSILDGAIQGNESLREEMRPHAQKLSDGIKEIYSDVIKEYGNYGAEAQAEISRRVKELSKEAAEEFRKVHSEAAKKAYKEHQEYIDRINKENEDALKGGFDRLKEVRTDLYNQDKQEIDALIKSEQLRLREINRQNKAYQEQIKQKNKLREQDLAKFDRQDKQLFAGMVSKVNYDALLAQGLKDIHNPEGVQTETYSGKSHSEAMTERIEQMKLDLETDLNNEDVSYKEYLEKKQQIAAIQARFIDEQLTADDLTSRQRKELSLQRSEAYVEFQNLYREAINNRVDAEVEAVQRSIEANTEQAEVIQATITGHQEKLSELTEQYNADAQAIDERLNQVVSSNERWRISAETLKDGVESAMNKIVSAYNRARTAATASASSLGRVGGFSPYSARPIPAMATGGVVPPGFPNDSYFANLTSGEMVIPGPDPIKEALSNVMRDWVRSVTMPSNNYSNSHSVSVGQIVLQGDFTSPGAVKRELTETFHSLSNGSRVNAAFIGPLSL